MSVEPIQASERVELLDILRGFAIFGMFAVNLAVDMWGPLVRQIQLETPDFLALIFVDLLASGKFLTIFAFLFGIGFFVQIERARKRGARYIAFYIRRSVGLFLIAILAIACTLPSFILLDYAIFGIILLLVYGRSPKTILTGAVLCFLVSTIVGTIAPEIYSHLELETSISEQGAQETVSTGQAWQALQRDGSFVQLSSAMLSNVVDKYSTPSAILSNLDFLGLMMLGLYVGRRGAIWNSEIRKSIARKALPWLLGVGFGGCLVWVIMQDFDIGDSGSLASSLLPNLAGWPVGMPVLGLGYAAAITLLVEKSSWQKRFAPFVAVGRMALTNFLITDLILAFVSFSWGLGLYGEIMPATGLAIVACVFILQVIASRWWMNRYRYGPVEWLWRLFTYGWIQALRPIPHRQHG